MNNAKTVSSGVSQRARKITKSKVVFKPVLDNPFSIAWPEIHPNVQNSLLDTIVVSLSCLREYHIQRGFNSRKRKRARPKEISEKRKKLSTEPDDPSTSTAMMEEAKGGVLTPADPDVEPIQEASQASSTAPDILQHVKFGINEVAKLLERHISRIRQSLLEKRVLEDEMPTPLVLFACRWDINPPTLLSHIPHLVASANTLASTYHAYFTGSPPLSEVKLVNLPKGAEGPLSEALGMRRVSVVALNSNAVLGTKMDGLLKMVPRLATPWLIPTTNPTMLAPRLELTHIKHLKTTMPIDMRVAKQERVGMRKAVKQRRKQGQQTARLLPDTSDVQMATDV